MLDFAKLIEEFAPRATEVLAEAEASDIAAISAVSKKDSAKRAEEVLRWLRDYSALRGIRSTCCHEVVHAFLKWADDKGRPLEIRGPDEICKAHLSLSNACALDELKGRRLTSLVSKMLWLRYPKTVPIFDRNAERALQVLCKLDKRIPLLGSHPIEYEAFVRVWDAYFNRNIEQILAANSNGYPYPIRIFDIILWKLGSPSYLIKWQW